jgi:hypothetical protein
MTSPDDKPPYHHAADAHLPTMTTRSDTPDQPARPSLLTRFRHHRARTRFIRAMLEAHDQPSRLDIEDVRAASMRLQAMVDGLPEQRRSSGS